VQNRNSTLQKNSFGLKLFIICFLVFLMAIPAMFISFISYDRSSRANDVTQEVAARYGGSQVIMGPVLVAPYYVKTLDGKLAEQGDYILFAESGSAEFPDIKTEIKQRSLYKVPIYHSKATLSASFESVLDKSVIRSKVINWDAAYIVIGISQVKGLKDDPAWATYCYVVAPSPPHPPPP